MATSKLQIAVGNMLDKTFPQFRIRENYRPDWLLSDNLTKLELDFYIEEINTAFEIQGAQHYQYTPFFHRTYEDFEKQKSRDEQKRNLCDGRGIKLIEVVALMDALIAIKTLEDQHSNVERSKRVALQHLYADRAKSLSKQLESVEKTIFRFSRGNAQAEGTYQQKIVELERFYKKVEKCTKDSIRRGESPKHIPRFTFYFLNPDEQAALMEEATILMRNLQHANYTCAPQNEQNARPL